MPSNFTENYNLSQWERTDKVRMEDFNADNAKIDAALTAQAEAHAALAAQVAKQGNCQLYHTSYTGNGQFSSNYYNSLTLPWVPDMVFIVSHQGEFVLLLRDNDQANHFPNNISNIAVRWNGKTVSWKSSENVNLQMNVNYYVYQVYAFRILS